MMETYHCWIPENCDEEDARSYQCGSAASAAELHAERCFSENDYPSEQEVAVRVPGDPKIHTFIVEARPSVEFFAKELT